MAQLVLGVAGAFVGSFFGPMGAQLGFALGSALGASMAPAQKQQGPRLNDLKVTDTDYGQPIPYVQGHPAIAGQVWWASDRREIATTTTQGGKGGGPSVESTSYSYEVDILYGLTDNIIAGVTRIWLNGKLVWSRLSSLTYESPAGQTTITTSAATIVASDTTDLWRRMTVYTGAIDQLPDPTYEAAVGTANAPAYRGRGSVFIEGLQLGSSGQLPNLTFEVATSVGADTGVVDIVGTLGTDYRKWGPIVLDDDGINAHTRTWATPYAGVGVDAKRLNYDGTLDIVAHYNIWTTGWPVLSQNINTDTPILISLKAPSSPTNVWELYGPLGQPTAFEVPETDNFCASYRRNVLHVTCVTGVVRKVYRYVGGAITGTSSALAANGMAIASDGIYIYVLNTTGDAIYQMDATTLAPVATLTVPAAAAGNDRVVLMNERDELYFAAAAALWRYDAAGASWTSVNAALGNARISNQISAVTTRHAMRGDVLYTFATDTSGSQVGGTVYAAAPAGPLVNETLQNVVSRLCIRAGMSASWFDVTALASITKPVRALAVSQVSNTRVVIELLMAAYFFEAVLSDKLYFRPRGGASVATIPYADLGASSDPGGAAELLALRAANDIELPAQIALSYINVDRDYQTDTQFSDRLISSATTTATVQMALGFNGSEAKGIANAMVMDQITSWLTTKIALLQAYASLEPTDPVTVIAADGTSLRMRLVKKSEIGGVHEFDAVLDDATVLTHSGVTMVDVVPSIGLSQPAGSVLQLMDIPILRDADNDVGFYVAVKGNGTPYPGAAVLASRDDVDYAEVARVTESAVLGTCTTTLPDWLGGNVFDEVSTVSVDVGLGTLASVTRDQVLDAGANACLIGSEILQFRDVALVGGGVYKLSGLLRGRRGTESFMTGHAASETFVVLQPRGLRRIEMQTLDIGVSKFYKALTLGRRIGSTAGKVLILQSIGSKPFSPVDLRAARDPSTSDITITWSRRTRLSKNFSNGTVPLGEASESYEIVIYTSGTFATVKRTLTATSPTVVYTSAQQVADFGSNQATVNVRIYQISAIVGRGYPAQGSI